MISFRRTTGRRTKSNWFPQEFLLRRLSLTDSWSSRVHNDRLAGNDVTVSITRKKIHCKIPPLLVLYTLSILNYWSNVHLRVIVMKESYSTWRKWNYSIVITFLIKFVHIFILKSPKKTMEFAFLPQPRIPTWKLKMNF